MKTNDFCQGWTHYDAVTCHRLNKQAHRRCIGPPVMLWLAVALANWLTAGVRILVGDLQNNSDTNTEHYVPTLWQSVMKFFGAFWNCSLVYTGTVPSPLTATSAKPDARGPQLGHFALLETPKLWNTRSKSPKVRNCLETLKHYRSVRSVRDFFRHRSGNISGRNYRKCWTDSLCRSSTGVYDPQWCHDLL